jgi:hypothetical protein
VAGEAATLPFWQSKFFYKTLDIGNELGIIITYKSLTPYGRFKMASGNGGYYFEDGDLDYDPSDEIERMSDFDDEDDWDDDYYDDEDEDDLDDEDDWDFDRHNYNFPDDI